METFSVETLSNYPCFIRAFTRTRIAKGWYLRAIFCHEGCGSGAFCESAIYFDDHESLWNTNADEWHWIDDNPRGGIFQCAVPGGWLMVATAKGETAMPDGEMLHTRFGSLVFVPDPEHSSQFETIRYLNGTYLERAAQTNNRNE